MKIDRSLAGAILFLVILTLVYHFSVLFLGEVYAPSGDVLYQNYPWRQFYAQELKAGRSAEWYPGQACGFPLYAEGQIGTDYPINRLFYRYFDTWTAINIGAALSTFLAGLGALLLFRRLKISLAGSALGASVYMLSGPLTAHLGHLNLVAVASLLPYFLLAGLMLAGFPKAPDGQGMQLKDGAFLLFVSIWLGITAGHPQLLAISVISALIVFAAANILNRTPAKHVGSAIMLGSGAAAVGIVFALGQIASTIELLKQSNRASFGLSDFLSYSYPPQMIVTFVYPFIFGAANAWKSPGYHGPQGFVEFVSFIGPVASILAIVAAWLVLRGWKSRENLKKSFGEAGPAVKLLFICAAVFFILALGKWAGIYAILKLIPGYGATRIPARFIIPTILMIAGLAGAGLDYAIAKMRLSRVTANLAVVAVFALTAWPLLWFHGAFNVTSAKDAATPVPDWFNQLAKNDPTLKLYYEPGQQLGVIGLSGADTDFGKPCYPSISGIASVGWAGELVLADYKRFCENALVSDGSKMQEERRAEIISWLDAVPTYPSHYTRSSKKGYYLCGAYKKFDSEDALWKHVRGYYPLYLDQVAMGTDDIGLKPSLKGSSSVTKVGGATPIHEEYTIKTDSEKVFVRTVSYYPGWTARIDGQKAYIVKVDGAFQGVAVPPGLHSLEFHFNPKYKGLERITFLLVFALFWAVSFWKSRRVK